MRRFELVRRVLGAGVLLAATQAAWATGLFQLSSPGLAAGGGLPTAQVYSGLGCDGGNLSPALAWSGAPAGTRSFAVTVFDPDAAGGAGWWHWLVFNLPGGTTGLAQGAGTPDGRGLPAGSVQSSTNFGVPGYGGACPPRGDKPHHYIFSVHAMKVEQLYVPAQAGPAWVSATIRSNQLDEASFVVTYGRR